MKTVHAECDFTILGLKHSYNCTVIGHVDSRWDWQVYKSDRYGDTTARCHYRRGRSFEDCMRKVLRHADLLERKEIAKRKAKKKLPKIPPDYEQPCHCRGEECGTGKSKGRK